MPALDRYHKAVTDALQAAGWTITDNPLSLKVGERTLYVDLAAERLIAAEKGAQKIAVEIKTFGSPSLVADLQEAIGQVGMYEDALEELEPDRQLYLAIPELAYETIFAEHLGKLALRKRLTHVFVYRVETKEIVQWIPEC